MTVVRNHTISRVTDAPMWLAAKWGFSDSGFSGTNRNFQVYAVPTGGGGERRMYTLPDSDQCWSDSETVGDRGWVVFEDRFFPVGGYRVTRVEHHVQMQAHNGGDDGQTDVREFRYSEPVAPSLELEQSEARLSCVIDANEADMRDNDAYQTGFYRTRTVYWVESRLEGQRWPSRDRYGFVTDQNFTAGSYTYNPDPASIGITSLKPAVPVMFRFCARNEGPSGASEIAYSEPYVFAAVKPPSVKEVRVDGEQTVFKYSTNADEFHPIDGIRLEKKVAASDSSGSYTAVNKWQKDVVSLDTMFDAEGTDGLDEDTAVFYRIAVFHGDEAQNIEYGKPNNPVRAAAPKAPSEVEVLEGVTTSVSWKRNSTCSPKYLVALHVKTESGMGVYRRTIDDAGSGDSMTCVFADVDTSTSESSLVYATVQAVKEWGGMAGTRTSAVAESAHAIVPHIDSVELLDDGLSIRVSETHDADGWDCTEYSWHTREDGWESTREPETHDVLNATTASHVTIVDLDDGMEYFVRARRKNSKTGEYGLYSSIVSTRTGVTPGQPVLSAPSSVAAGAGIELTWDFRGSTQASALLTLVHDVDRVDSFIGDGQTDAFALTVPPETAPAVEVDGEPTDAFSYNAGVIEMDEPPVDGSILKASYASEGEPVTVEVDGSEQGYVYRTERAWSGTVTARVRVTCGGKWSDDSEPASVEVVQPPLCTAAPAGTLADGDGYGGHVLTALPLSLELGGTGDVWEVAITAANGTNEPTPAGDHRIPAGSVVWTSRTGETGASDIVTRPGVIATGGQYDVTVTCIDSATGSRSAPSRLGFVAQWASPALEPTVSVEIMGGKAHVTASRDESDETSTLSLWRRTADGAIECVSDAGDGIEYIDGVPPYGWDGCGYIAMVTTADGDIRWVETGYEYPNGGLTVDFDGRRVVLPFNIGFDDGYQNTFESRAHLDGHRSGCWEPGTDRTASVSGQLPRRGYDETVYMLRQLGRYPGIAFVRDVSGIAFPCHVDVSVSASYEEGKWDVDLSITEVDDDGTWALSAGAVPKEGE